jgi:hypothetical protein
VQAICLVVVSLARIGDLFVVRCIELPAILAALNIDFEKHRSNPLSNVEFQRHLFEYRHGNSEWGIEIDAESPEDAKQRLKALAWANYRGRDLPLKFHPAAFRVSGSCMPGWAG